jgi:hypothetical protein
MAGFLNHLLREFCNDIREKRERCYSKKSILYLLSFPQSHCNTVLAVPVPDILYNTVNVMKKMSPLGDRRVVVRSNL